jgi:hypothetical protein
MISSSSSSSSGGGGSCSGKFRLCSKFNSQLFILFTCLEMATLTVNAQLSPSGK